ncbi:acetyl-CoA hydrolase/transferase C-terminal domain-containing protein [Candidatus Syntrophocurvum alkaliphilum]|nr:acetyl-CoA hydrolase/transferase C-terminal domain-containing protein [Candidatus Syntrophocurvum alkaliphilum]
MKKHERRWNCRERKVHMCLFQYCVADLKYRTRKERANELIAITHLDLRGELRATMRKNFYPGG